MPGSGADVGEAELLQEPADRPLVIIDAELLGDDVLEVHPAPAHHAVHGPVRAGLDQRAKLRLLRRRQPRRVAPMPVVLQPVRPALVEPVHPVPQRLTVHAAHLRSVRPVHSVQHRRQRQQTPALVRILRRSSQPTKVSRRIVRPKLNS